MAHDEFSAIRLWTRGGTEPASDGLTVGIGDDAAVFSVSAGYWHYPKLICGRRNRTA